jgi:2-polyprenyl-3-methyl-5-hydroxy-6-metoxy-1,4-benzoquinol methylase
VATFRIAEHPLAISNFGKHRFPLFALRGIHSVSVVSTIEYGLPWIRRKTYDELASQYHLIFENWELSVERQAAALSSILHGKCGLATTARILDCACGIGTQSLGLAKMGFRVSGCDLSPRAIERARLEASRRNVDIHFSVANMLNLTSLRESHFDAVICMDNALPHLESAEQLFQAAKQFRARPQLSFAMRYASLYAGIRAAT